MHAGIANQKPAWREGLALGQTDLTTHTKVFGCTPLLLPISDRELHQIQKGYTTKKEANLAPIIFCNSLGFPVISGAPFFWFNMSEATIYGKACAEDIRGN